MSLKASSAWKGGTRRGAAARPAPGGAPAASPARPWPPPRRSPALPAPAARRLPRAAPAARGRGSWRPGPRPRRLWREKALRGPHAFPRLAGRGARDVGPGGTRGGGGPAGRPFPPRPPQEEERGRRRPGKGRGSRPRAPGKSAPPEARSPETAFRPAGRRRGFASLRTRPGPSRPGACAVLAAGEAAGTPRLRGARRGLSRPCVPGPRRSASPSVGRVGLCGRAVGRCPR